MRFVRELHKPDARGRQRSGCAGQSEVIFGHGALPVCRPGEERHSFVSFRFAWRSHFAGPLMDRYRDALRHENNANFGLYAFGEPLSEKIIYIIRRGKENVLLLRSIFVHTCGLDRLQAGRLFSRAETQKDGKRNEGGERKENGRYYNPIEKFFQYIKSFIKLFFQRLKKQTYSRGMYGP